MSIRVLILPHRRSGRPHALRAEPALEVSRTAVAWLLEGLPPSPAWDSRGPLSARVHAAKTAACNIESDRRSIRRESADHLTQIAGSVLLGQRLEGVLLTTCCYPSRFSARRLRVIAAAAAAAFQCAHASDALDLDAHDRARALRAPADQRLR